MQPSKVRTFFSPGIIRKVLVLLSTFILIFAQRASAQQTVTESTLSAPSLTAQVSGSAVALSWGAVSGAARYELQVWDSVNGWRQIGGNSLTGTAYTHSDVTVGTTYYYAVRAANAAGETSAWSEYASVAIPAPSAPSLTAQASGATVELSWNAVSGATRYALWVWDSVTLWRQIGGDSLTGTTYTHSDVTVGTTYHYAIRAVNAAGETSAWSEYVSATPQQGQQEQGQQHTSTPTATPTLTATPTVTVE